MQLKKNKKKVYDIEINEEEEGKKKVDSKDPLNNPYVKKEKEKVNSDKELTTKIKCVFQKKTPN